MILLAIKSGWPDRVASWDHSGPVPDGHMAVESIAELDAWKAAHPELAPQPEPVPDPVPDEVPMWALKEVCMLRGYTAQIEAAFVQLPQPQQSIARNRWENKETLSRASAHIEAMRVLMGWSNDQVDEMFRAADLESKR